MTPIEIRITGHPVPQGRPKAVSFAGHARIYKPAKSRRWEEDARQVARQVMGIRKPLTGCLAIELQNHIVPPRSWPAWKIEAALTGRIRPTGKPDRSNLLKAAEDALNGVVWIDDSQIIWLQASKLYSEQPVVVLKVWKTNGTFPSTITKRTDLDEGAA